MTSQPAEMGTPHAVPRPWRAPGPVRLASLAPFMVAIALQVVRLTTPAFSGPLFDGPAVLLGLPLRVVIEALVVAWAGLGALIVWTTGSRLAATLSLALITLPSMFAMILGPAILLVVQNLEDLD